MYTDPSGYTWLSNFGNWVVKNWKPIVATAIAIGATIATAGLLSPLAVGLGIEGAMAVASLSGMAGGFAGGFIGAALNGASLGQSFIAGFVGGVTGGLTAALTAGAMGAIGSYKPQWDRLCPTGNFGRVFPRWQATLSDWANAITRGALIKGISNGVLASSLGGLGGGMSLEAMLFGNNSVFSEPNRINFFGSGDHVVNGIVEWGEYLYNTNSSLANKTSYGRFYSIDDIFYNLPPRSSGGYGTAGDILLRSYQTSGGHNFSIAIQRDGNQIKSIGKSFNFNPNFGTNGELNIYFQGNKTSKSSRPIQLITIKLPGVEFYSPIGKRIFKSDWPL
jgi:hypothetical protein